MGRSIIVLMTIGIIFLSPAYSNAADKNAPPLVFDPNVVLSSLIAAADGHIKAIEGELELAALTEEAASLNWQRIRPLLMLIQYSREREAIAWFALPDGTYYTVNEGLMDKNINDRPYFSKVLAGKVSIGDLVVSRAAFQISTVVSVPIKKGNSVAGMLGVSLFTKKLSLQIKSEMGFSDDVIFFALDKDHITIINAKPELVFLDPEAQGSSSMTKAVKEMLSKNEGSVEYDFHGLRRVVFRKSTYTNWWYAVGLPVGK